MWPNLISAILTTKAMAKYGKNNYFDGVVLPEPKEEALRRMAKGVNTTRVYLYARSIDIDKYNGDRSFQVAFTTGDDITTTQYIRTNYPLGLVISNDRMYVSMCCLLYTSPSPRDGATSRMPSSA